MAENPIGSNTRGLNKFRNKTQSADMSQMVFGKIPPQARDLEEAVLGACMLEKDAVSAIGDFLKPECFYVEGHQLIFTAIMNLFNETQPIDILTVAEQLRKNGHLELIGGAYYLTQLSNRFASAANIEYHGRIIQQKYLQRELIKASSDIIKDSYEETTDVFELLDRSERNLFQITDQNMRKNYADLSTLIEQAKKEIHAAAEHQDKLTGVASGFIALDRMTGGWQKSDLIIVAARPGMGKTSFVLSMAKNAALIGEKAVALFSLEMAAVQLTSRLISSEAELSLEKLRKGNLASHELQQMETKVRELSKAKIFIDDTPALSVFELRAKARRLKAQHNVELIIIDYLQLMSAGADMRGNREQEISTISRSLKAIAKELNIPVIALSQLSRSVETRGGNKRPMLSDLRESGAIEQDADMVVFIYRPEYYGILTDDNQQSTDGKAEIIIAKHRNGALDTVEVRFVKEFARFEDWGNAGFPPSPSGGFVPGATPPSTGGGGGNPSGYTPLSNFTGGAPMSGGAGAGGGFTTFGSKMNDMPSGGDTGGASIDYNIGDVEDPF